MKREQREPSKESIFAFTRLPHKTEADRQALQGVFDRCSRAGDEAKRPRALQHFENASYLLGNHLTKFYFSGDGNLAMHTFGVNDSSPYDRIVAKVSANHLLRPSEDVVGMLTDSLPEARVEPGSDDPQDEEAAETGGFLVDAYFDVLHAPRKLQEAVLTGVISGTAVTEIEWKETNTPVRVPKFKHVEKDNPLYEEGGPEPERVLEEQPNGFDVSWREDLSWRNWNHFHITVDPAATSEDDLTWVQRTTFEDIDWVWEAFNKNEEGYFPENLPNMSADAKDGVANHSLYWFSRFQDILESPQYPQHGGGFTASNYHLQQGYAPNQVIFSVLDVRPSQQFPEGRTLIFAGGVLLYAGKARAYDERYPTRWHPYAFWNWFELPGRFWGAPLLSFLVPLQKKINAIDALVQANRQYISIGQWLIPKHSKLAEGRLSGIPGEHYIYTDVGGALPQKVQNTPLPAELLVERDRLVQMIELIASTGISDTNDVSASAARAGIILEFLRNEKLRSKSPMIQRFKSYIERIGQNILIETQINITANNPALTERINKIAKRRGASSVQTFVGADLRDHHHVLIDVASDLLQSKEAMGAKAMEFAQIRYSQGTPLTPNELQGVFKATGLNRFIKDEMDEGVRKARRMISNIIDGKFDAIKVIPGLDPAPVMAKEFQRVALSPRFDGLPETHKAVLLQMFDGYAAEAQRIAEEARQAAARAEGAKSVSAS